MPDGFNMVTAMETIHRHIHAVGCGALPSCWMTGDPSFFCRADGLFVPSLAVWFGAACRRPFGDGSWDGYLPPMPRGSMWGVRDHRTGDGWRRYISYGSHGVVSDVMEIMEAGGGKREVRFFFRRDAEAGRVAQACGRVELRRVPFFSGLQCFVWTTSLGCAIGGYNLSFRYGAPNPTNPTNPTHPTNPGFWDIL